MAVYEGKWRCPACQNINLGRHLNCQSCGFKANESVEYFLDNNPSEVADAELLALADQAENWHCNHCNTQNRAGSVFCESCGNARDAHDEQRQAEVRSDFSDWQEPNKKRFPKFFYPPNPAQNPNSNNFVYWFKKLFIFIPILFVCGLCQVCGVFSVLRNPTPRKADFVSKPGESSFKTVEVEVVDLEWKRSVAIEEYQIVTEKGWKNAIPPDAKIISREQALRNYEQVKIGTQTIDEEYTERVSDGEETYTEEVRDGTESYTDSVTDYESYTESVPETERYKCGVRNKGNGFFEDVYCTRTKYRTVTKSRPRSRTVTKSRPRYKTVTKTRPRYKTVTKTRPKVVPVYESRPIYDTQITYRVKRWIKIDELISSGRGFEPFWEKIAETKEKRGGEKTEEYKILLQTSDSAPQTFWKEILPAQLEKCPKGTKFTAKISNNGEILEIEGL